MSNRTTRAQTATNTHRPTNNLLAQPHKTPRMDPERLLRLRVASTLLNRSERDTEPLSPISAVWRPLPRFKWLASNIQASYTTNRYTKVRRSVSQCPERPEIRKTNPEWEDPLTPIRLRRSIGAYPLNQYTFWTTTWLNYARKQLSDQRPARPLQSASD